MKALPIVLLVACAPTMPRHEPASQLGSRGLRADAHLDAATEHARRADELQRWPDTRREAGAFDDAPTGFWYRSWDTVREEEQIAVSHRAAASQIHATFDEACANVPAADIHVSPLRQYGVGGMQTEHGVTVFLSPAAGPADTLLARMRCHRAWMMLEESDMSQCPLDLAKIEIRAYGNATGVSVEITTANDRLVPELQRRAARDLEAAASGK
ncbi:MAG: hypothetical protein ABI867_16540 [Kofleriaceae bacterium]